MIIPNSLLVSWTITLANRFLQLICIDRFLDMEEMQDFKIKIISNHSKIEGTLSSITLKTEETKRGCFFFKLHFAAKRDKSGNVCMLTLKSKQTDEQDYASQLMQFG